MNNLEKKYNQDDFDNVFNFLIDYHNESPEEIIEDIKEFNLDPDKICEGVKNKVFPVINQIIHQQLSEKEKLVIEEKTDNLISQEIMNGITNYKQKAKELLKEFNLSIAACRAEEINIDKMTDEEAKHKCEELIYICENKKNDTNT